MAELLLITRIGGRRIAFPASEVEAVVELEGLTPAPRAAPHVAGLSALRSRVLTVIDCLASLGLGATDAARLHDAVVVPSGGHPYALLVEEVEDVLEAATPPVPARAPIGAGWDRVAIGMIEADGDLLLLVDPHQLVVGPVAAQAA
jgi:purine-binding chemotaxis protein CheW